MLIAGIVTPDCKMQTEGLINSILTSTGRKVSMIDAASLSGFDVSRIRMYLRELDMSGVDILILRMCLPNVRREITDLFNFDIILYTGKMDDSTPMPDDSSSGILCGLCTRLDEKGIVIVNVDDAELIRFLNGLRCYLVTYGFNSKASITTSSVGDTVNENGFMCCLQRAVHAKNGILVEPQEYRLNMELKGQNIYSILAAVTFAIVNGVDPNSLSLSYAGMK